MKTLLVTDLDGTLWDNSLTCHPDVITAIGAVRARSDTDLLLATGRRRNSARSACGRNGFSFPSILLNGAIGVDFTADQVFHHVTFADVDQRALLELLRGFDLAPIVYLADGRAAAVAGVTTSLRHLESLGDDLVWLSFDELAGRNDTLGMSMLGVEQRAVEGAIAALAEMPTAQVVGHVDHLYAPFSMMIAPADTTKAAGIEAYCTYRAWNPERIIAVGDGGNDVEMLAMADIAVVVAGGDSRALELADHVIEPPAQGGWADVVALLDA